MARNRNVPETVTTTTVIRDAADILVAKLNEIDGITFVRDAWENKAPDNYGAVGMTNQSNALWADDRMVEQVFCMYVHLYCKGGGNEWITKIQEKLEEASDWYNFQAHEFVYEIGKNHWTWAAYIVGPLQWEEVVTGG